VNEIRNESKKLDATKTDHGLNLIWFIFVFRCMEAKKKMNVMNLPRDLDDWWNRRMPLLEFLPSFITTVNLTANCDRNEDVLFNPAEAVLSVQPPM